MPAPHFGHQQALTAAASPFNATLQWPLCPLHFNTPGTSFERPDVGTAAQLEAPGGHQNISTVT